MRGIFGMGGALGSHGCSHERMASVLRLSEAGFAGLWGDFRDGRGAGKSWVLVRSYDERLGGKLAVFGRMTSAVKRKRLVRGGWQAGCERTL